MQPYLMHGARLRAEAPPGALLPFRRARQHSVEGLYQLVPCRFLLGFFPLSKRKKNARAVKPACACMLRTALPPTSPSNASRDDEDGLARTAPAHCRELQRDETKLGLPDHRRGDRHFHD